MGSQRGTRSTRSTRGTRGGRGRAAAAGAVATADGRLEGHHHAAPVKVHGGGRISLQSMSDCTAAHSTMPCVPLAPVRLAPVPRRPRDVPSQAAIAHSERFVMVLSHCYLSLAPVRGMPSFLAQSAQRSAQMGAAAEQATEERPWRCSSSASSTRCSACCLGHLQRRHRCRHHSTSRPSVARGGLPSRGLTVACARDVADCRGSVHLGCALMHRQQQASAAACWRARALGLSRCGLPRWCQGVHSGCSCACVRMYLATLDL